MNTCTVWYSRRYKLEHTCNLIPNLSEWRPQPNPGSDLCNLRVCFGSAIVDLGLTKHRPMLTMCRPRTDMKNRTRFQKQTIKSLLKNGQYLFICSWNVQRAGLQAVKKDGFSVHLSAKGTPIADPGWTLCRLTSDYIDMVKYLPHPPVWTNF